MLLPDNGHTQKRRYHEHPLGVSHGNLNMAIAPYRYTLKRTAKPWGSLEFCSVSSDNFSLFFSVDY